VINIKIDSLRIRIKAKHVEFLDSELTDQYARLNINTAELVAEDDKTQRLTKEVDGCRYDFQIRRYNIKGDTDVYFVMTINAKMLRYNYFDGLTQQNIQDIYQEVMGFDIVKFSWGVFVNRSYTVDIDFSLDFVADQNEYQSFLHQLQYLTPFTKERDRGYKNHEGGLEWNSRANSNQSNPYIKTYNKEIEMRSRSWKFMHSFLEDKSLDNLCRFEFTIKGSNHLKSFGILNSSLYSILGLSQEVRKLMLKGVTSKVFDLKKHSNYRVIEGHELKPDKKVLLQSLRAMADMGFTSADALDYITKYLKGSNKTKYKNKVLLLWNTYIEPMTLRAKVENPVLDLILH
jgi:hypothetical protein